MNNNIVIYLISFFSGFLSLAQEIIWMRLISFAGMSVPQTFSYTLALFLVGIAVGASIGKYICKNNKKIACSDIGLIFFIATIVDLLLIGVVYLNASSSFFILIAGGCVFFCAMVRGIAFPMVHHIGANHIKTGKQISNVYFSNVFGSALAPILIGFVALDYLNTQQVYILVCFLTLLLSVICFDGFKVKFLFLCMNFLIFICLFLPEKIFYELSKNSYEENSYPVEILENKHGFIQIYNSHGDKAVFGANVYDGKFNTDLFHNTNGIDRAYFLTTIRPDAKNALVIGLSTGSWVKVLSLMPSLEKITIVEINPAYVELIKKTPIVSSLLQDKRIEIIFDDGRKWLKKNQDKKFDIVLMNTTWHWRAYGSNLLSINFLDLVKSVLNNNSVFFYNTTQSLDAFYTAKYIFPKVYKYKFFILASNQELYFKENDMVKSLCSLKDPITKEKAFPNKIQCVQAKKEIMKNKIESYEQINFLARKPELITDDNMITEFKYGKGF
ncbi:spermidine synthase [Acinetobacter proteolyticus]|uniref:spermidine synthase n=1 Tax=Acinetobacter proteolyticus TaxID=1776741 RepID=UPI003D98BDFB